MVATGFAGLVGAVGVLVAVTMTSCELAESSARARRAQPGERAATTASEPPSRGAIRSSGEPEMRVRILAGAETIRLSAPSGMLVGQGDPRGVTLPTLVENAPGVFAVAGQVTVALRAGQWSLTDARGERTLPAANALVFTLPPSAAASAMIAVNGQPYPGSLRLSARTDARDTAFDVVEFVGVEDYLAGVVAKEMLAGWPLAAYQAQAVAARSYALQERDRSIKLNQPFDVESSERDQVYAGASANPLVLQAVRSTRGVVLKTGSDMLRAYFSSTCGGRTASAKDTWPTGPGFEFNLAPPIQASTRAFSCESSPLFRWTVERPRAELVQRLRLFGERNQLAIRRLRDLAAIEPMTQTDDGRPSRYKIIEPGGAWYQLSAEELRLASNTGSGTPALPTTASTGPSSTVLATAHTPPRTGKAAPTASPLPEITRATRVNSSDFRVEVRGDRVVFTGRGFGHGVGLCQYCARGFAARGEDWRTMIERFYPGVRIVNMY